MKRTTLMHVSLVAAALALTACSDSTTISSQDEAEISEDVAAVAGDAVAADVNTMIANEASVGPALPGAPVAPSDLTLSISRTRTCLDSLGVAQTVCSATLTSSIQFILAISGNVSLSHTGPRGTDSLFIAVHRNRTWTISGLLGVETSRTHNGAGTSSDTVDFSGTHQGVTVTKNLRLAAADTVSNVTFNLPHGTNPWPISGTIVRRVSGNIEITRGDSTRTHTFARRVLVTFPADAQGNVSIDVNGVTCTLNLVTHVVANCST